MKLSLRTKLILSYVAVIILTLALFAWVTDLQVGNQVESFIREFQPGPHGERKDKLMDTVRKSLFWTFLGATGIATLLSIIFANSIVDPLKRLTEATKAIASGKYKNRITLERKDEIGELTQSLNQMAEDLEEHQTLQQDLITNVSHELGTPLTSMKGYIEALLDNIITAKTKRRDALIVIRDETQRLENMLREVRELALIQQPKFRIKRIHFDLKKSLQGTLRKLRPLAKEKGIKLSLKFELTKAKVHLDEARLTQILINLISNAIKFSPEKSTVIVRAWQDEQLKISVSDQGSGIAKADRDKIFQRFYQGDSSRQASGTGIGLAIVKELVEAHGGEIHLESSSEGSVFTLGLS